MAASSLALSYTDLRRWIAREVGVSRTPTDWSTIQTTDMGDALKHGLRRFYYPPCLPGERTPHVWSFLQPTLDELTIHAPYSTGTVGVTTGTVTLTSGTWPSWAASGEIYVNDAWYTVASRTSGSVIVLDDATVTISSGKAYTLVHREYALPDDFGGVVDPFSYQRDESEWTHVGGKRLQQVSESRLRSYDDSTGFTGPPEYFAIVSVAPTSTTESRQRVMFGPTPDQDYRVWYRYMVVPPALDGNSNVYAHGSAPYSDTLLLSCLDAVLQMLYSSDEKHGAYMESLISSVHRDRLLIGPVLLGKGNTLEGREWDRRDYVRRQSTLDTTGYGF